MRVLLVDHGSCDPPQTRVHGIRAGLERLGIEAAVCGPSSVPGLEEQSPGMYGIHLRDVAAASRVFLAAVKEGSPQAFLEATAGVPARLLGLARETARQALAEAVDLVYPDVIFVLHAGILADLAVETGAPVVVHVTATDLAATAGRPSLRNLVAAAIGSSAVIVAEDDAVAAALAADWLADATDAAARLETWALGPDAATRIAIACRRARRRA
ncbi:MAG: hypothetical protein ACKONH_00880 [Planctomycetia bacterium]